MIQKIFFAAIAATGFLFSQVSVPANPLSSLRKSHPRLFVTSPKDFENLKTRIPAAPFLAESYKIMLEQAETMLNDPLQKYTLVPSKYLLNVSRAVLAESLVFSAAYLLTSEKKYKDRLWKELQNAADFPDWEAPHFLGTAEMTYAFAVAYDWLYAAWTPEERKILKTALLQKDGKDCAVEILSPAEGKFEVWEAQPKLNEPLSEGNAKNEDKKRLVIHLKESAATIAVVFKDSSEPTSPKLLPLAAWEKK